MDFSRLFGANVLQYIPGNTCILFLWSSPASRAEVFFILLLFLNTIVPYETEMISVGLSSITTKLSVQSINNINAFVPIKYGNNNENIKNVKVHYRNSNKDQVKRMF